jgi:hypothetical protein
MLTVVADLLGDDALDALLERLPTGGSLSLRLEEDRAGRTIVKPDDAVVEALRLLPRLVGELKRVRGQVAEMEAKQERQAARPAPPEPSPAPSEETLDDLGSLLSAAFRVSPRAAEAARTEPLAALAVQVAKASADGASEKEKARLIAMAFAASEGDLEGFWQARRSRKAPGAAGKAGKRGGGAS